MGGTFRLDIPGISPYILHIGSFGLRWYGVLMALSMAIGIWYVVKRLAPKLGEDFIYNFALVAIVGGVVGARFVFVATNPGYFIAHPVQIPMVWLGGLSIHGGLLGGFLASWWYAKRAGRPIWPVLDAAVYGICWGIILVRIGNIFNHEILGHPSDFWFGRQPAQIYEMIMGGILLYAYTTLRKRNPPDGYLFWNFFFWYSILRFISEMFRANPTYLIHYENPHLGIGFVTLTQWFSPLLLALAWWERRARLRSDQHALESFQVQLAADGAVPGGEAPAAPPESDEAGSEPKDAEAGEHGGS